MLVGRISDNLFQRFFLSHCFILALWLCAFQAIGLVSLQYTPAHDVGLLGREILPPAMVVFNI